MSNLVESIKLNGARMTLTLSSPLHSEWKAMAAAAAVRILEHYPVIDNVVLNWGGEVFGTSRKRVEQMLRPDGFSAVSNRARWQEVINRLVLEQVES